MRWTFLANGLRVLFSSAYVMAATSAMLGCGDGARDREELGVASLRLGAGTFEEVTGFGSNPGALKMYQYIPSPVPAGPAPLVLALHACTQDATDYRAAGWEELADKYGFYVVYAEQQSANNSLGCFNWAGEYGNPTNLTRGQGENQSMKEMVDKMIADYGVDAKRVFAAGHSGGGAQAALLMATWPEVFAATGILAGIPYNCTTTYFEVSTCLNPGKNLTPEEWGKRAKDGHPGYAGPYPRMSVWHGTTDNVVSPTNRVELIEQWTHVHGIAATPTATDTVDGYPHEVYKNANGDVLVESFEITGAGHGTFVDPDQGCGALGSYFLDHDICAAYHMGEFFGIIGSSGSSSSGSGGGSSASSGAGGATGSGGSGAASANTTSAGPGGSETSCVPGRQRPCACSGGGESFETCNEAGTQYGACDCPEQVSEPSSCALAEPSRRGLPLRSSSFAWLAASLILLRFRRRFR